MFCRRAEESASNFVGFSVKVGRERQICRSCGDPMAMRAMSKITGNFCGKERQELAVLTREKAISK